MAVTTYRTYNGRLRAEVTDGVRTTYLTDALGSVTATVDSSQTVLNTYRYKPSGDLLAKTGSSPDPRFLWSGDTGGRNSPTNYAEQYERQNHLGHLTVSWISPNRSRSAVCQYLYAFANPTTHRENGYSQSIGSAGLKRLNHHIPLPNLCTDVFGRPYDCVRDVAARTDCCVGFGLTQVKLCTSDRCLVPCTKLHENVHAAQISDCCKKLNKCFTDPKRTSARQRQLCNVPYQNWLDYNNDAFECAAYQASAPCFLESFNKGCSPGRGLDLCCSSWWMNKMDDEKEIKDHCTKAKGKKLKTCPFDDNGNY